MILLIWHFWTALAIIEVDPKTNKIQERDHTSMSKLKRYYSKGRTEKDEDGKEIPWTDQKFKDFYSNLTEKGTPCGKNYPFVFDNGNKCCFGMKEKKPDTGATNSPVDESCNGGELFYSSTCCFNDNFEPCTGGNCYSNTEYIKKRMQTRMVPYEGSEKIQLDAIDIKQVQCRTDPLDPNSACSEGQECLFSQRDDVANGRWGCYDGKFDNFYSFVSF